MLELTALACLAGVLVLLGGAGAALLLVKLGVIGKYWLKGQDPPQTGQNYTLDQSADAADLDDR